MQKRMLRSYLHFREGRREFGEKFTKNNMNENKKDSLLLGKHNHEFDAQILDCSLSRNECKFPQIDICKLQNSIA